MEWWALHYILFLGTYAGASVALPLLWTTKPPSIGRDQTYVLVGYNLFLTALAAPLCPLSSNDDASWVSWAWKVPAAAVLADFVFGVLHAACHLPFLYKHFHCVHHRLVVPEAWASFYAHPLEHLGVNLTTTIVVANVLSLSHTQAATFVVVGTWFTCTSHCVRVDGVKEHGNHHALLRVNYGSFPFAFDRLLGSYFTNTK